MFCIPCIWVIGNFGGKILLRNVRDWSNIHRSRYKRALIQPLCHSVYIAPGGMLYPESGSRSDLRTFFQWFHVWGFLHSDLYLNPTIGIEILETFNQKDQDLIICFTWGIKVLNSESGSGSEDVPQGIYPKILDPWLLASRIQIQIQILKSFYTQGWGYRSRSENIFLPEDLD